MKESKFEISKVYKSGGKNIGIRKFEFVTKTRFLSFFISSKFTNLQCLSDQVLN